MIYDLLNESVPIRQGDIFERIPKAEIVLDNISFFDENDEIVKLNIDEISQDKIFTAIVPLNFVPGIVISQDCDISRTGDVSFCQIVPFEKIDRGTKDYCKPKQWMKMITQEARKISSGSICHLTNK